MDSQEKQSPISAISQIGLVRSWNWIIGLLPTTAPGFCINAEFLSDHQMKHGKLKLRLLIIGDTYFVLT